MCDLEPHSQQRRQQPGPNICGLSRIQERPLPGAHHPSLPSSGILCSGRGRGVGGELACTFVSRPLSSHVRLCLPPSPHRRHPRPPLRSRSADSGSQENQPQAHVGPENGMWFRKVEWSRWHVSLAPRTPHPVGKGSSRRGILKRPMPASLARCPSLRQHYSEATGSQSFRYVWFSTGGGFAFQGSHGTVWGRGMLLPSSGQRPAMPLNILQCTGPCLSLPSSLRHQKIIQPKMSIAPRLRNPVVHA